MPLLKSHAEGSHDTCVMSEEHKLIIRNNWKKLVDTLDVDDIKDLLIEIDIITQTQCQRVMQENGRQKQVSSFLELLLRRGSNAFEGFLESLKEPYTFLYDKLRVESEKPRTSFKEQRDSNDHYYYAGVDVLQWMQGNYLVPDGGKRHGLEYIAPKKQVQKAIVRPPLPRIPPVNAPSSTESGESAYGTPELHADSTTDYVSAEDEEAPPSSYVAVILTAVKALRYNTDCNISLPQVVTSPTRREDLTVASHVLDQRDDGYRTRSHVSDCETSTRASSYIEPLEQSMSGEDPNRYEQESQRNGWISEDTIGVMTENNSQHTIQLEVKTVDSSSFEEDAVYAWEDLDLRNIGIRMLNKPWEILKGMGLLLVSTYEEEVVSGEPVSNECQNSSSLEFDRECTPLPTKEEAGICGPKMRVSRESSILDHGTKEDSFIQTNSTERSNHSAASPASFVEQQNDNTQDEANTGNKAWVDETVPHDDQLSGDQYVESDCVYLNKGETVIVELNDFPVNGYQRVYDRRGEPLRVPLDCIKRYDDPRGEPWFYPININEFAASALLQHQRMGTYIFYNTRDHPLFKMSMVCDQKGKIRHFQVNEYGQCCLGFNEEKVFATVQQLQAYYSQNRDSAIPCRLRKPPTGSTSDEELSRSIDKKHMIESSDLRVESSGSVGKGISGQVTKALLRDTQVAVKRLLMSDKSGWAMEDFIKEAQILLELKHENIINCHGIHMTNNTNTTIVMELCEKRDLRQCLKSREISAGKDVGTVLDIFKQILAALEYLKTKHIIHRDIASRNVFITSNNQAKLGDFGMARYVIDDVYHAEDHESIPVRWAPPEVLSFLQFSSKSDVYAAGVTLWEMYSGGEKPHNGKSGIELTQAITKGKHLDKPDHCPENVYELMKNCWEKEPSKRPSAGQLRKKLFTKYYYTSGDYISKNKQGESSSASEVLSSSPPEDALPNCDEENTEELQSEKTEELPSEKIAEVEQGDQESEDFTDGTTPITKQVNPRSLSEKGAKKSKKHFWGKLLRFKSAK